VTLLASPPPDPDALRAELERLDRIAATGWLSRDHLAAVEYRRERLRRQLAELRGTS
jgi:hypothetical protein